MNSLKAESIELDNRTVYKLDTFAALLYEWNKIHNLTGAKNIKAIYDNIIDALYPIDFISFPKNILDVGTGAGFPGLVLAIALPNSTFVLSEPLKKRASFLRFAIMELGLENVRVEAVRVEDLDAKPFDMITSRAVTNTNFLLKLTDKVRDNHTQYLLYKGSKVFDEINEASTYQLCYDILQKNRRNYLYIKSVNVA
ncbi:MAG: 16S rRNA (guanine(527)-N(7))-methyltransferase RsmG [Campylobacterales bacterium]|nr:16S rRNA (guanine(527)-N(7))-methyltransferase RsmG [Campylobacterales bacterium]